ncbi:putative membrane protein [Propionispora sp. 2/2-37]|uniref:TrkH family potassium uptake protein n=1 Tax=Propionispora sp. 2/2-37 TaxID=1677858 RepID=UPI0006BB75C8|nr:TrkH family potassium uptake protein [Propionispora sp. 2/2-37]CUH95523.1 putative membrane protein [Propionispora sp. 2/2-37]
MPKYSILSANQFRLTSYQILVSGFFGLILLGAFLLMLPVASTGQPLSFLDALFTATSAVCVTGLVVVDTGTHFTLFGQIIILLLIQLGALGIMTVTTLLSLLIGKKIHLKERIIMQEALNQLSLAGVVRLTLYVVKITLLIEFIGGTLLAINWYPEFGLQGIYYGYWHAISAFCNAGFDLFGNFRSLTGYVDDVTVNITIMLLILLGGLGFGVLADLWRFQSFYKLQFHTKIVLVTNAALLVTGFLSILLLEFNNPVTLGELSTGNKLLASLFQSITPRTAGYNTIDIAGMTHASLFVTIILMFVGASPGSTGGGIKTTTFGVVIVAVWSLLTGKEQTVAFERQIPPSVIYKAFAIIFISGIFIVCITMLLSISESVPFLHILFEVVSAFGTVGLTTGITPSLTVTGKLGLMIAMFAGRVGPVTLALAIVLRSKNHLIKYPNGKIIIG